MPKITRICETCGSEFLAWPYKIREGKARFCNRDCIAETLEEIRNRLFNQIEIGDPNECWPFKGWCNDQGYGIILVRGQKTRAHRLVYELTVSPLGEMKACHTCDNPTCCNPDHIFPGTTKDNADDMMSKGRGGYRTFRGEDHGNSKLTSEQVLEIRRLVQEGNLRYREIAERFDIAISTVGHIKTNRLWKHLGGTISL
jgi:HNH endonuclease